MLIYPQRGIILDRWQAACACRTAWKKQKHCLFKPDTMMFKTHKIWFSPEFAPHLGSTPAGTPRACSHPRGPQTKDFFKPFIDACAFATVCLPASCTIRDFLQDNVCAAAFNLPLDWRYPPTPLQFLCPIMHICCCRVPPLTPMSAAALSAWWDQVPRCGRSG